MRKLHFYLVNWCPIVNNIAGVYVVTSTELGWDCVVGVFDEDSVDLEELENTFPESGEYVITFRMVEKSLGAYK